jgi:hypothetical protein
VAQGAVRSLAGLSGVTNMSTRNRLVPVLAAVALMLACRQAPLRLPGGSPVANAGGSPPATAAGASFASVVGPPRVLRSDDLSPAERLYGHSAAASPTVTLQPDVVVPPAGADAIRSVSDDGLVWRLDPETAGAARIEVGKVLLLTSRATGRVLGVETTARGLEVILGPVDITEVIRDGQFSLDAPVDMAQAITLDRPAIFDQPIPFMPVSTALAAPGPQHAAWNARDRFFVRPAAYPTIAKTPPKFRLTPLIGSEGVGVRIVSKDGGVMFLGQAVVYVQSPRLRFVLDISGGVVKTALVELSGIDGLLMEFESALLRPSDVNFNESRFAASDFGFPIGGVGGVPLAASLRQQFLLNTAFTSSGSMKARGHYTLQGGFGAGYTNGAWGVGGPTGINTKETLLPSIDGAAIGLTGLVMTHQLNVIVGVGAAGFVAGPYAFLNSSVSATRGPSVGFDAGQGVLGHETVCRRETVAMGIGAGVGYQIPRPVTNAINAFLRALNIRQEIQGSGGIQTAPQTLVNAGWFSPPETTWCGGG